MSSFLDDIKKKRTRQPVGEQQPTVPIEPVAPVAQPMNDQASARVAQGAMPQAESGFNPTAEQKAAAMALMNPAAPGYTIPQQAVAPAATTPAQPAAPKQMSYTDLYKSINPGMTPEEKAAQQKRQRNRQIINAVGDGISALANLYYTNKSGVNAYDPSTSLTKAAKERYDKLLAQQREDEERYKELAYRSGAADIEMAYRRAKDAAAEKRADKAADDEAGYKKRKDEREVAESEARIAKDNALKDYYEAQANYYTNGGKKSGTSGSSSTGSKDSITLINDDGTTQIFKKSDSVDFIHSAYTALPSEFKIPLRNRRGNIVRDDEGNIVYNDNVTQQQMLSAIARYNARELKKDGAVTGSTNASPLNKGKMSNNNKDTGSW